jgi:hypothetical protein
METSHLKAKSEKAQVSRWNSRNNNFDLFTNRTCFLFFWIIFCSAVASTKLIYVPFFLGAKLLHVLLQFSLSQENARTKREHLKKRSSGLSSIAIVDRARTVMAAQHLKVLAKDGFAGCSGTE